MAAGTSSKLLDGKEVTTGRGRGIDALSPRRTGDRLRPVLLAAERADHRVVRQPARDGPWPDGHDGLTTLPLPAGKKVNPYLLRAWASATGSITARLRSTVPFRVPTNPLAIPGTGTADEDDLELPLAGSCNEILLLLAAAFPHGELIGSAPRMTPLKQLDEPERAALELVYADGDRDELLPLQAATPLRLRP